MDGRSGVWTALRSLAGQNWGFPALCWQRHDARAAAAPPRKGDASSLFRGVAQPPAGLSAEHRASVAKGMCPRMRPEATSRGQNQTPRLDRRSQRRGTFSSRTATSSTRPPCRLTVCSMAQGVLPAVWRHTAGSWPRLREQSSPARRMFGRFRCGVAWRSSTGAPSVSGGGVGAPPRTRVATAGRPRSVQPSRRRVCSAGAG